jgi:hypothetical protein
VVTIMARSSSGLSGAPWWVFALAIGAFAALGYGMYFVTLMMEKKRQRQRQSGRADIERAPRQFQASDMWGKTAIGVTQDGFLVDQRPGVVFPFSEATLGPWTHQGMSVGTTLHLVSGPHHFALGGVDHRKAAAAPFEAPDVEYTDATISASDFDELVAMVAQRRGWHLRGAASAEPTRCVLVPNTSKAWTDSMVPWADFVQRGRRKKLPHIVIATAKDTIWVIEQDANALVASAPVAQVTATPSFYNPQSKAGHVVTSISSGHWEYSKTAVLVLGVPGLPPLTIACPMSPLTSASRFEWHGEAPREKSPDYLVSGPDWLTLVETFGLTPRLLQTV